MDFFAMFELLIGGYILFCAITGKGKLYVNENVKKGQEQLYAKRMRMISAFLGPIMIGVGAVDIYSIQTGAALPPALQPILFGVSLLLVAAMLVVSVRMTDRSKQQAKPGGGRAQAPRSAFEFDEDE